MKKKIMSALLAACLLLGLVIVRAAAEGNVCVIEGTGYSSLTAAVTDASIGDTIWMTADDAAQQQITIEKSLTIELQGFSLPSTALKISGSGTTVALNDRAGTARINTDKYTGFRATENSRCDATIYVTGGATLTISGTTGSSASTGTIISECADRDLEKAVFLGNGTLTINGGTFAGRKVADAGSKASGCDALFVYNGTVTINDGYFSAQCGLSYNTAPSDANPLTIRKGVFDGGIWIEKSGTINGERFSSGRQSVENVQKLFLSASAESVVSEGSTQDLIKIVSALFLSDTATSQTLPDGSRICVGSADPDAPEVITATGGVRITLQPQILGGDGSPISYKWEKNGMPIDTATTGSYTIESFDPTAQGDTYTLTATQNGRSVTAYYIVGKAAPAVTPPTANTLTYTGAAQALVTAGSVTGGTMQYSLDGSSYSTTIPTGTEAKEYTVWYKVTGDTNHNDTAAQSIFVTIAKATATVTAPTGNTLTYNGKAQALITGGSVTSAVPGCGEMQYSLTEEGDYSTAIPTGEDARTYTVYWKVEGANTANYNYVGDTSGQVTVTIGKSDSDVTGKNVTITYGDSVTLTVNVAPQATGGIALTSAAQNEVEFEFPKGEPQTAPLVMSFDGTGAATLTIEAKDVKNYLKPGENIVTVSYGGSGNLNEKDSVTMTVTVNQKTLDFTFTATDRAYNGSNEVTGSLTTKGLVGSDSVTATLQAGGATADSADAGTQNVTVDASKVTLDGADAQYYTIGTVDGGTVTITPAELDLTVSPVSIIYGETLTDELLSGTAKIKDTEKSVAGTWAWDESSRGKMPTVGDSTQYKVVFTPSPEAPTNFTEESRDKEITVTVGKADSSATVTGRTGLTYSGKEQALVTKGSVTGGTVVYALGENASTAPGVEYTEAVPTGTATGSYYVWWKVNGDENHNDTEPACLTVTIGKSDSDVTGDSVTITYGKNVNLTVNVAPQATGGIALTRAAQDQVEFKFPKGEPQTAPVVMSSDGKGTATLTIEAKDVKNYLKPGENIVTVSYGGSGNLNEKDSVEITVTVNQKTLDFTFTATDRAYNGSNEVTGSLTMTGLVGSDSVTATLQAGGATADSADAGSHTVTVDASKVALGGTDAQYYTFGTVDGGTVTISKATISSVTPPAANGRTYDGTEKALVTAPASIEGGTMRYALGDNGDSVPDNSKFEVNIPQAKDAGTYYVWYYVKGDDNHNDSDMDKVAVTIGQKPVTLTWSDVEGLTYTGNEQSVTATIPEGVIESGDKGNVTVSVSGGNQVEANPGSTYTATASLSGDRAENYTLTNSSQTYTIHKAASSVAASASDTPTYGESITLTATVSASGVDASLITGTVTFKVGGATLGTATVENGTAALTIDGTNTGLQKTLFGESGTSTVTAAYGGNANITDGSGETEVAVTPRALTYTVTATDKEYDGETAVAVTLTPNNLVGDDVVTLTATGALSSANTAAYETVDLSGITKGGADAPYYTVAESAKGQPIKDGVTVRPRVAELVWKLDGGGTFTVEYTGKAHAVTADVSNKVNSDDVSVTVRVKPDGGTGDGPYDATATDVGAYTVTATALTGGAMDNYTLKGCATTTQAVAIQPVAASATVQPEAKAGLTYSGAAQELVTEGSSETGTVVYALSADAETQPDDGAFTEAVPQGIDAGTYYVWWKVRGDGNHSDTAPQSVSVTIARAPVSFTIGAEAKPAHDWTEEPNADPNLDGYAIAEDADPAVWNDFALTMTYDSLEHRANVLQDSGVAMGSGLFSVSYKRVRDAAGDAVTGDAAGTFRDAGTYEIWVTLTDAPQNFMFAGAEPDVRTLRIGTVTVKPYEVRVTWQNVTFVYHGHKMHPTVRVENAFLADEQPDETEKQGFLKDPSSFHAALMAYAVTDSDDAGSYLVTVALYGSEAGNYTVSNPTATVVIQPAPVVFEVTNNEWLYHMDKGQERDVTLTASWGEVTNAPDTVLGDSYPGAGTKITLNDLGVTAADIEYRLANGTVVDNPTEIGTYQVWVRIPNANFRHASASGGDFHNVGILRIAANDHPATYTVTFDPGRDERGNRFTGVTVPDPMKDLIPTQEITLPPAPENAPMGYVFAGWSRGGALYQPNEEFYMVYSDVTFEARWTKEIFNISGVVIDDTESPIPYVSVALMMGEHQMGLTTTDKDGAFRFDGLIPNTYNLVFTWNGVVKTYMVEITDKNVEGGTYTLPGYRLNTVVEVAPGSGSVVVDLDPIITDEEASELYDTPMKGRW